MKIPPKSAAGDRRSSSLPLLLLLYCYFVFGVAFIIASPSPQQDHGYDSFTFDASRFPSEMQYDYIVVGGGTTGCPLAATLSESHSVLLLERGGSPAEYPDVLTEDGFLRTLAGAQRYDSPAQPFTSEDGIPNARGRVLGGSSAINAGFYSRAHPGFFEETGTRNRRHHRPQMVDWDMLLVNASFEWIERAIAFQPELKTWQSAFRDGLLEANVTPYNGFTVRHVQGTKIGATTFEPTSGRRRSAADLLRLAKPENIRVALKASVERVLFNSSGDGGNGDAKQQLAATGVVFRDQLGGEHRVMTVPGGEVIICAGALGSPQLLLLSGIGPRRHLTSMGIPVAYHNPFVGRFMYDNPRNGISITAPFPLEHSLIQVVGITGNGTFIEASSNVLPYYSPARALFLGSPAPVYVSVASVIQKISQPVSFGSLWLASTDVRDNPLVRFNYYSKAEDLSRCVTGMKKIGEVLYGRSFERFRFVSGSSGFRELRFLGTVLPANLTDNAAMEGFCKNTLSTIWHYHGGCIVGKVVDGDFKVIGVESLRVADGSVLSSSPGTNPQATLLMLGRYLGQKINIQRSSSPPSLAKVATEL